MNSSLDDRFIICTDDLKLLLHEGVSVKLF